MRVLSSSIHPIAGTGELGDLGRLQFKNNRKAIEDLLNEYAAGLITEKRVRAYLSGLGLGDQMIADLITDAADGSVDSLPPADEVAAA